MRLTEAIAGNVVATLIHYLLALATGVITARMLGPEGRGVYVLALLIPYLAVNLLNLGVGSASSYFIAKGERDVGTALGTSLLLVLPLGVLCTVAIDVLLGAGWWPDPHAGFIGLTAWSIVPMMGSALLRNAILGLQRYGLFNWLVVMERATFLLVLVFASGFWGGSVWLCCFLFVLASFVSLALSFGLVLRGTGLRLRFDLPYARRALHYGLRGHVGWLAEMLNLRLDMLLVEVFAGSLSLGLYSTAVSLAETIWILPGCISLVILPRLASAKDRSSETTTVLCRVLSVLILIAIAGLGLLGGPLIRLLYGDPFRGSLAPLLLLLPGVAVMSLVKVLSADIVSRGRPGLVSAVSWISLVVTVLLDLVLIKPYAASGAAVASSVAYSTSAVVTFFLYWRLAAVGPGALLVPRASDARLVWSTLRQFIQRPASETVLDGRNVP